MEKLIVYGSLHCPDTQAALKKLTESKIEYEFKNISGELENLKEFLKLRDTNTLYERIRQEGRIGIPCFVQQKEKITLNLVDVLEAKGMRK